MSEENGTATAVEDAPAAPAAPVKKAKIGKPKKAKIGKPKKAKIGKPKKERKPTLLDAAAKVIRGLKTPLSAPEILERIEKQKLWKSPKGKTPVATLSTAIRREIGVEKPRFKYAAKGKFLPA